MSFHLCRLIVYLVTVWLAWTVAAGHQGGLFATVCAAAVAVVGCPALLLSLEGIGHRLRGWRGVVVPMPPREIWPAVRPAGAAPSPALMPATGSARRWTGSPPGPRPRR